MEIKPIKTKKDYYSLLKEIETSFKATPDTPEGDRLDVLTILLKPMKKIILKLLTLTPLFIGK